jgi:hypothetical protein
VHVILGGEQQHGAALRGRKVAQTRGTGGHRDGKIEREEGLEGLGLPPDDSDRLCAPQACLVVILPASLARRE